MAGQWVKGMFSVSFSVYQHGLILVRAWINNYIHHKVLDEIIYPFPNFNGATD